MNKSVKNNAKKIAIALSGGIDSLVAGYLLKQTYTEVFGIHFSTGYETKPCDLSSIAEQLDIKIKHIDLSCVFKEQVVDYFINTYISGKTPNPCIVCNKTIKFGALLKSAKSFGADAIATGHYVKIQNIDQNYFLQKGIDSLKDQSYFLSSISKNKLMDIIFPLGNLTKTKVKAIAKTQNLIPLVKKESQDICFLKQNSIFEFINSKTGRKYNQGDILTTENKHIGTHNGLYKFTIGQRKGINCPASEPYYVKNIDIKNNKLIVCFKNELFENRFRTGSLNWFKKNLNFPLKMVTKIRYNHKPALSIINKPDEHGIVDVEFKTKQFAITPGQTAVFYDDNIIVGSGIII